MRIDNQEIRNADIFETIIDHFPDIIHSVDGDGNIVFANNKAEELLGYPLDELVTMNVRQLYADEVLEALERGFSTLKESGENRVESILKDVHGNTIPVEIRSFGIYDDEGKFIRTFSILRDIRQVKQLQQSLMQAGRLAAIGELASGIVHDINNPLAVITLSLQSAEFDLQDLRTKATGQACDGLQECLQDMGRAAESVRKLATHLKNFARGMAAKAEVIDIGKSIDEALFITQSRAHKNGVTVDNRVSHGTHFTAGCANHIDQVFANLITNACDAMEGRPERVLTISIGECEGEIDDQPAPFWECTVNDTGAGIPQHLQEDVFQSFFTTKPQDKGTGLGLAIVRGIVNDSKGDIQLESVEGEGTTFRVRLPRRELPV
jgi:PAS domain S-box-containing protein